VETTVDLSGGDQEYIEDCQVCCKPIRFVLQVHGEEWMLDVFGEND
ncbi:MAG: CPXCG motif-containing cysteine-rich protein, partial [Pseudomonas putida]